MAPEPQQETSDNYDRYPTDDVTKNRLPVISGVWAWSTHYQLDLGLEPHIYDAYIYIFMKGRSCKQ